MDEMDKKILRELQKSGTLTMAALSEKVGLSIAPCHRRVKQLKDDGIIQSQRYVLNRKKLGFDISLFVHVKFNRHSDENTALFRRMVDTTPEVVSCFMVSGDTEYVLEVTVSSFEDYQRLLHHKFLKLPMIQDLRSNFILETLKRDAPLPI